MRPSRIQTYMEIAHTWAKRSTCFRLNVGAVIVHNRTIIAHGYNGVPEGAPHCSGNDCPGKFQCQETIHAEVNAIKRAKRGTFLPYEIDMYCTDSPCQACAIQIEKFNIRRLFFATPYRITGPLDYLITGGVEVYRVTPAGYVIEWGTQNVVEIEV